MEAVPYLRRGAGRYPSDGGCILQIIDWVSTGGWTDRPQCVDPYVRAVAMHVNDMADSEERQQLLDLIPRMMNTATSTYDPFATKLRHHVEAFNTMWFGKEWRTKPMEQHVCNYTSADAFGLLYELLDMCDEHFGRTNHAPVDLTDVCAVMAAS